MTDAARVLSSLGDAVIALGEQGQVLLWPPAAERLFGHPSAAATGRQLQDLGVGWPAAEVKGERRLKLRGAGGRGFLAAVSVTELERTGGVPGGQVLVVKDLEPWIGPSQEVEEQVEGLDVVERLGATFRGVMEAGAEFEAEESLDQLAQRLAVEGRRLLPGVQCMVAVIPAERQDVFLCIGAAGAAAEQLVGRAYQLEGSIAGRAVAAQHPAESARMDSEGADPGLLASIGIHTLRAVPLLSRHPLPDGRTTVGVLTVLRSAPVNFSEDERRLIDTFGALVSLSIQRAELQVAADRSMARLQLAIDVALDLSQSLDVRDVVRRLLRRVTLDSRAQRCVLLRVEGADTVVEDAYDVAGYADLVGYRQPVRMQPLMSRAIATGSPVLGGPYDLSSMPEPLREALSGVRHTATAPLLYGGEVVAMLVLSRRSDPPFGQEEVDTLRLLGGPAALALRNSFLYAQIQEAGRVKSDFLDMAAHELRAPLTVIGGYLSMLREDSFGPAPPSWAVPLQTLETKVAELTRLVEDLLMAARLETSRLTSIVEPVDLAGAIARATAGAGAAVQVLLPDRPVKVLVDRLQLARMLDHLLGNALAYTRTGQAPWACVEVTELTGLPAGDQARITFEDRGRGIPPESAWRVFQRFQRIEDPEEPAVPGTGLGLYIASQLAERHGGRLELEWSRPGEGSRFGLYLPLAR